jgi:hypothetical protein
MQNALGAAISTGRVFGSQVWQIVWESEKPSNDRSLLLFRSQPQNPQDQSPLVRDLRMIELKTFNKHPARIVPGNDHPLVINRHRGSVGKSVGFGNATFDLTRLHHGHV